MKKLNVAVIGTGKMGTYHVKNYSEIPEANLIAVCDIREDVASKIAEEVNCKFYLDYNDLIENEDIDLVSIAVPTRLNKEIAIEFLKSKINVLLEKPLADSIKNAEEIIKTAEENNVKLLIGHTERFNPAVIKMKELIKSEQLGEIKSILARRLGPYPSRITDTDILMDLAVHDLDIINYFLNDLPTKVKINSLKVKENKIDYADIFLIYENATSFIQVSWINPIKIRDLKIIGTKGYAELDYMNQTIKLFKNLGEENNIEVEKEQPLKVELLSFINCVKKDKKPEVTGEEALNSLKIILQNSENEL